MGLVGKWISRCGARVMASHLRARIAALGLCVVMLAGAGWLIVDLGSGAPAMVSVSDAAMDEGQLATAAATAARLGIIHRIEGSRLMVPASQAERLRAELTRVEGPSLGQGRSGGAMTFEQLAAGSDIWTTQAQSAKRWQAAKMAELSRLIADFPGIRRATVIIEPGTPPGLGRAPTRPTAAVQLSLTDDARVTGRLVEAIADLVSGSVLGMATADVRIVDSNGRSYRAGETGIAEAEDRAERQALAEATLTRKVRATVAYIAGVVVSVTVDCGDEPGDERCTGARVSVPRSYLAAAYRAARTGAPTATNAASEPNDAELDNFAGTIFPRVRDAVASAVGIDPAGDAAGAVKVDWHYDTAVSGIAARTANGSAVAANDTQAEPAKRNGTGGDVVAAGTDSQAGSGGVATDGSAGRADDGDETTQQADESTRRAGAGWMFMLAGLCCAAAVFRRRRSMRSLAASAAAVARNGESASGRSAGRGGAKASGASAATDEAADEKDPLARLATLDSEKVAAMLADEHPQTQALVLSQVSADTAAEVIESLAEARQVDVARRIAGLAAVDPAVTAEAIRGLIEQWTRAGSPVGVFRREAGKDAAALAAADELAKRSGQTPGGQTGGVGKVVRILNHAGGATEKAVLDGLAGAAPAVAESIRKRMFVFDDVALLPRTVLRSALENLGGDELAIALRTAGPDVTEKILSSLPKDAAAKVREEMDSIGPVRLSDVEAAQERVVSAVRRLEGGLYTSSARRGSSEVLA